MKNLYFFILLCLPTLPIAADEYTDPATNVIYTFKPGNPNAIVKCGDKLDWDNGTTEYVTGSPDAKDDIYILDKFTMNGEEYVVDQSHTFINDLILGNLDEPYVLDLDEASGIKGIFTGEGLDDDGWYTLQGFKLPHKPRLRGVYIHNGTKVVIE